MLDIYLNILKSIYLLLDTPYYIGSTQLKVIPSIFILLIHIIILWVMYLIFSRINFRLILYKLKPVIKWTFIVLTFIIIFIMISASILYFTKHDTYTLNSYHQQLMVPETSKQIIANVKSKYSNACYDDLTLIQSKAKEYDMDLAYCYAIPAIESSFRNGLTSRSNAHGIFQVKEATANEVLKHELNQNYCISEESLCNDSYMNILIGMGYLKRLRDHYFKYVVDEEKQLLLVAYAYNGGITRTLKAFHPNSRTAQRIINNLDIYEIESKLDLYFSHKGLEETVNYPKKLYEQIEQFRSIRNEARTQKERVSLKFCVSNYFKSIETESQIIFEEIKQRIQKWSTNHEF